jgi:two-component system phosphate regulon response regulator PhoB
MTEIAARKKVLVVDDEMDVASLVAYHLRAADYTVETLCDPVGVVDFAKKFLPDLIILDVMMPKLSGIQVCRLLRDSAQLKLIPVFFLTARVEEGDRIQGMEAGADDYISKPFSCKELVLKVKALFRRLAAPSAIVVLDEQTKKITHGEIVLDIERHEVLVAGAKIELTATEFKLLQLLMSRRGRVQTREHLLVDVWNYETEIETRTVDTHVRRLREKLGAEADWIETIRGVGYRMAENKIKS